MRILRWIAVVIGLMMLGWAGFGLFVWSRNRFPPVRLPQPIPPPARNVYDQYVECARRVQGGPAQLERLPHYGTLSQKRQLLAQNRQTLEQFHRLVGQPCGVTHLQPAVGDPYAEAYRDLARLVAIEGKFFEQQGQFDRSLSIYLDGLTYVEDLMRGGATLHLAHGFMAGVVLFQAVPSVVPRVSLSAAERGAQRLENLLKYQFPLKSIFEQEYRVHIEGWRRTIGEMSTRGFRLALPKYDVQKQILYCPKHEFIQTLSHYMEEWIQQASQPYPRGQMIQYPPSLPESAAPDAEQMATHAIRYVYKDTRLRLLYTALRLESYRRRFGHYPATLQSMGASAWFTDPFSNQPFVYRPKGDGYVLYSVGPNGRDEGGASFLEGKIGSRPPGDLNLVPNFIAGQ